MNHETLDQYLEYYLDKDRTKGAVMLTGDWGTGKSYYINNLLFNTNEKKRDDCIIISLYGLTSLSEISNRIYLEIIANKMKEMKKNVFTEFSSKVMLFLNKWARRLIELIAVILNLETPTIKRYFSTGTDVTVNHVAVLGKTYISGFLNNNNMDFREKDVKKLLKSIGYNKSLIIFEDLERTSIDLIDFMGYVNNLVEQDGSKILLVANENEIMDKSIATEYKRIKEKTVSSTIKYNCDTRATIVSIIKSFNCAELLDFTKQHNLDAMIKLYKNEPSINFRTFLFACQKTSDLLKLHLVKNYNDNPEFIKTIFFGIIAYSIKMKNGEIMVWNDSDALSYTLGSDDLHQKFHFMNMEN